MRKIIETILARLLATFSCEGSCYLGAVEVQAHPETRGVPSLASALEVFKRLREYTFAGALIGTLTKVTAYCPCPKCCGKWAIHKTTASGHKIKHGDRFVAAPADIPFGTMLIVPGYNGGRPVSVLDRGGAITGNHIDVFFDTHEEATEWGVQYLEVKIHEPIEKS